MRLSDPAVQLSRLYPALPLSPLVQMVKSSCIVTSHAVRHTLPSTALQIIALDGEEDCPKFDLSYSLEQAPPPPSEYTRNGHVFFTSGMTGVLMDVA